MSDFEKIAEIIRKAVMRGSPAAAEKAIANVWEILEAMIEGSGE